MMITTGPAGVNLFVDSKEVNNDIHFQLVRASRRFFDLSHRAAVNDYDLAIHEAVAVADEECGDLR